MPKYTIRQNTIKESLKRNMRQSNSLLKAWPKTYSICSCRDEIAHSPRSLQSSNQTKNIHDKKVVLTTHLNDYELDLCCSCTLGTQAKAAVNKCLQVSNIKKTDGATQYVPSSTGWTSSCSSALSYPVESASDIPCEQCNYVNVYYLRRNKRDLCKNDSIGIKISKSTSDIERYCTQCTQPCVMSVLAIQKKSSKSKPHSKSQSKPSKKTVSIKDEKSDMHMIAHIQINPRISCPTYGTSPCQGPNCKLALDKQEDQSPVKITKMFNPRRGVFEIVVRKVNGAKVNNELMLEWTPPSHRCPFKC